MGGLMSNTTNALDELVQKAKSNVPASTLNPVGTVTVNKATDPSRLPDLTDAAVKTAGMQARTRLLSSSSGRRGSFLTGPDGVQSTGAQSVLGSATSPDEWAAQQPTLKRPRSLLGGFG